MVDLPDRRMGSCHYSSTEMSPLLVGANEKGDTGGVAFNRRVGSGAEGRTRTDTGFTPADFESAASTNSATPAGRRKVA